MLEALNWIKRHQLSQGYEDKGVVRARRLADEGGTRVARRLPQPFRETQGDPDTYLDDVLPDRIANWAEIIADRVPAGEPDPCLLTIEEMAKAAHVEPADVLMWLRVGCPYVTEGDWQTGEGFVLRYVWAAEWAHFVFHRTEAAGRFRVQRMLGLHRSLYAQARSQ